jgi:hypothetical protein
MRRIFLVLLSGLVALLLAGCGGSSNSSSPASRSDASPIRSGPTSTGPTAMIDPRMGPPGTQVVVSGTNWPAGSSVVITGETAAGQNPVLFSTVQADRAGAFSASFRLEKTAGGDDLKVGPYQLVVRAASGVETRVSFQVQTARPVPPTPGGG